MHTNHAHKLYTNHNINPLMSFSIRRIEQIVISIHSCGSTLLPDPSGILLRFSNSISCSSCIAGHCSNTWLTLSIIAKLQRGHCLADLFRLLSLTKSISNSLATTSHCAIFSWCRSDSPTMSSTWD